MIGSTLKNALRVCNGSAQIQPKINTVTLNSREFVRHRLIRFWHQTDMLLRSRPLPVALRQIGTTGKIPVHANRKSSANCGRPVPARGAVARRHERGTGCGGRKSVGTPSRSQRGLNPVSDCEGAQDERRLSVRQNRVVLTPRRWRQVSRKAMSALTGATRRYPRGDGDKQARSPGRARHKP